MSDIATIAANFTARRPLFQDPTIPDSAIPRMVDAEEADLFALAALPSAESAGISTKARILASTLFVRLGGITEPGRGEWALLKSLLADLQR